MATLQKREQLLWAVCFSALVVLALVALWPGVSGPFLFDDFANIVRLSQKGCVDDRFTFLWYVFGGHSAAGRPLSYLSFLLQDYCWPTDPRPMKVFNLLWHLLNFVLLLAFLKKLLRIANIAVPAWAALALAGIWVVHPINVSAIFLTVQRMTLMMSTCVILGMMAWLHGRELLGRDCLRGHIWMWGGMALGGIVGALFKETAIAMPFFILAMESTLLAGLSRGNIHAWRLFFFCCLLFPLLAAATYVLLDPQGLIGHHWLRRPYTAWEKFLTEFRVLFLYAREILVPDMTNLGIYHDTVKHSTDLFNPLSTMLSVAGWVGLLLVAWLKRHAWPLVSLGVFWFFGGHVLEGLLLPLELYFEHRNYLPGLGVLIMVLGLWRLRPERIGKNWWHSGLLAFIVVSLFSFISYASAMVWGDQDQLITTWYMENQGSQRATQSYIRYLLSKDEYERAHKIMQDYAWGNENADLAIKTRALYFACPRDFDERWEKLVEQAYHESSETMMTKTLNDDIRKHMKCPRITTDHIRDMALALLSNEAFAGSEKIRQQLYLLYSYTYADDGWINPAMYYADQAYKVRPNPLVAKIQAEWLLQAGLYDAALEYVNKAIETPENVRFITLKGDPQLDALKERIQRLKEIRGKNSD